MQFDKTISRSITDHILVIVSHDCPRVAKPPQKWYKPFRNAIKINVDVVCCMLNVLQLQLLLESGEGNWYSLVPKERTPAD